MLNDVMLSVVMLSDVMLSVGMPSVVEPFEVGFIFTKLPTIMGSLGRLL